MRREVELNNRRLVDLLLVRLTREEEKNKVIDLLKSELGMSDEEARNKVDNSPSILSEGVEMEQGRILQNRMYPFVDLLPRHYNDKTVPTKEISTESDESTYEMITDDFTAVEEKKEEKPPDKDAVGDLYHNQSAVTDDDYAHKSFDDDDDDSLIITSASEEMLSVERCHICGRTPTDGQKLVPCRTCGNITCSECFNREHHVCEKCATEGRDIDRPLDSIPESEKSAHSKARRKDTKTVPSKKRSGTVRTGILSRISPLTFILTAIVLIVAAFMVIDPLNLFSSTDNGDSTGPADSHAVIETDSLVSDTVEIPDTTTVSEVDTTVASADSLLVDSTAVDACISLRNIILPDSIEFDEEYTVPRMLTSSPVTGIEIQTDSLAFIADLLGQLADANSITFDGISLVRTEDGFNILLMSILHPEPAEKRAALLGNLGNTLDSTMVDQIVLYYRENQYYEADLFCFTADSFSVLSRSSSPYFLQRKQAIIPETTELVTGKFFDWMTDLN